jgi:hypothetical protein
LACARVKNECACGGGTISRCTCGTKPRGHASGFATNASRAFDGYFAACSAVPTIGVVGSFAEACSSVGAIWFDAYQTCTA